MATTATTSDISMGKPALFRSRRIRLWEIGGSFFINVINELSSGTPRVRSDQKPSEYGNTGKDYRTMPYNPMPRPDAQAEPAPAPRAPLAPRPDARVAPPQRLPRGEPRAPRPDPEPTTPPKVPNVPRIQKDKKPGGLQKMPLRPGDTGYDAMMGMIGNMRRGQQP